MTDDSASAPAGPDLVGSIRAVRAGIAGACRRVGRDPGEVLLVAVTKTVPVQDILRARDAGISDFGENYASELSRKATQIPARWHFIGRLQRGTAAHVADHAEVIHSAEPGSALRHVAGRAWRAHRTLRCLVQVDYTGHHQGIDTAEVDGFLDSASELEGIRMVGLMTLPPWTGQAEATRPYFARLRDLRERLRNRWPELTELSMGMSGDYEVAVEEGATMVRVGTALFGERPRDHSRG